MELYFQNKEILFNSICYGILFILWITFLILYIRKGKSLRRLELSKLQHEIVMAENEKRLSQTAERCEMLEQDNRHLLAENVRIKSDFENQKKYMDDKLAYVEKSKEELALKFRDISNEIIKSQNQQFNEEQKNVLSLMLKPFQEQMAEFKHKVETVHEENIKSKSSFDEQMKNLFSLNQTLSKDAQDLSMALKGNKKIQGNWGEFQLERILEVSGLQKGLNYHTQETFRNENNQMLRPDVIVKLPNDRNVIIDSKVSLNDYVNFVNCEDDTLRQVYLKKHIQCLRGHIDELSGKEYQRLVKSQALDYVVIFVPVESAYVEAVRADNGLYDYAYKKNIMITTPSSLLPILRTIENLWQIEHQNKNVAQIAEVGGYLYDKIVNFSDDMQKISKSLESAQKSYEQAMNKLSAGKGNALSLAVRLKALGAKTTKSMAIEFEQDNVEYIENEAVNE